ncbi:hypothetical protein Sste5346_005345 [Sporothrix stenoceras]|uniref:Uncharacterized protein n=1 Tax=Sporothrix stenoceras TaxID=5173 RepID=A0ABR3Z560_9PEZI
MAAFLEDPRLRQRWNQLSHNAETVTENAAAGIWTFQQSYVNPCLASLGEAIDSCTAPCLGDREDRARRQRERARGAHRSRAEYSFDFYDDWYDDFNDEQGAVGDQPEAERGGGGLFGSWRARSADWDRLLAGSGSTRNRGQHHDGADEDDENAGEAPGDGGMSSGDGAGGSGEVTDQPRRGRGMSYSTRAMRRKHPQEDDPTVIPSTAPLGFLSRLPWKIGGTLRYKPSAANLREHPNSSASGGSLQQNSMGGRRLGGGADMMRARDENEPLLGGGGNDDDYQDGTGTGSRRGLLSWQSELEAADASRQYGTALSSVPATRPTTRGTVGDHDEYYDDDAGTTTTRKRSGTTSSGDTSNSFRSRGDLFPSDEEDDEDAVPLDDEFAVALNHVDDRSSGRTRFSSSSSLAATGAIEQQQRKGKKRADTGASTTSVTGGAAGPASIKGVLTRSVSRTTIDSVAVGSSPRSPPSSITNRLSSMSLPLGEAFDEPVDEREETGGAVEQPTELTAEQIREEDERAAREEDEAIEKRREAAARLAKERGLTEAEPTELATADKVDETNKTVDVVDKKNDTVEAADATTTATTDSTPAYSPYTLSSKEAREAEFVPARLPRFD